MSGADLMVSVYAALGRGEIPTVLAAMDPGIQWREAEGNPYMPSGEPWIGPDAILNNLFVKLGEDWDDFTLHPASFHDAGEIVTVEGRYTARHKQTGMPLDAQFCHVWTIKGGKITKFQQYVDTAKLQEVTGARVG